MKKISLLMALLMIATAFFAVPFSASAEYAEGSDILVYKHTDGDGTLASATNYSAAKLDTTEVTAIQKVESDTAIHVNYTAPGDKNSVGAVAGTPNIIVDINSLNTPDFKKDGYTDKTYLIYQADVFLANDTASFGTRIRQVSGTHSFTVSAPNGASVASGAVTNVAAKASVGEWHRVQYVWNMKASSTNKYKPVVYVDGTPTYASNDTAQTYAPTFGTNIAQYGWNAFIFPTLTGATNDCWVDNITIYQSTDLPTVAAKPVISASTLDVNETEKTIGYTDANATAADITAAITSDADSVAIYNNSTLVADDAKVANGYKVCLNKGGRISVYSLVLNIAGLSFESNNANVVVDAGAKTITCYPSYAKTVASFVTNFSSNADIKIYDGENEITGTAKVANGNKIKLIQDGEVVDEYTVVLLDELTNKATYTGSNAFCTIMTGSNFAGTYSVDEAQQIGYKAEGDTSYKIVADPTAEMSASTFILKTPTFYTLYGASESYGKIIMSYDIYPKAGNFTIGARHRNSNANTSWIGYQIKVNNSNKVIDSSFPTGTMELGKWYHVTYEFSHDGVGTVCNAYINGVLIGSKAAPVAAPGFNTAQVFSSPMTVFSAANEHIEYYLDNVKFDYTNDVNYNPVDDFAGVPELEGASGSTYNMSAGDKTVADFKAMAPAGGTVRVYDNDDAIVESGDVDDGYTIAVENAAGLISLYKVKVAKPYQEVKGNSLAVDAGSADFTVNNIENGVKFTSSSKPFTTNNGFSIPLNFDVASLGNVYTFSFDYKFEFADGIEAVDNAGDYMTIVTIDGKGFFSLGGANGFCLPATSGNTKINCHIGTTEWTLNHGKVAGMSPDTTYRVQFTIDKNNNKLYLFIDDVFAGEAPLDANYPSYGAMTKFGTLSLKGRAGNGTEGEIWTTMSNFRAVKGMGDLSFTIKALDVDGNTATVNYSYVSTFTDDVTKNVIVAAYAADGRLISAATTTVTAQNGMSSASVDTVFAGDVSSAASYKAFVMDGTTYRPYAPAYELK